MRPTKSGAPPQGPASQKISRSHHAASRNQHNLPFSAQAWVVPKSSSRKHDLYIVRWCPFECGEWHTHRAPGVRRAQCGRGRYTVLPPVVAVVA